MPVELHHLLGHYPRKLDIAIGRFELNPGKSDIVRSLNEHAGE